MSISLTTPLQSRGEVYNYSSKAPYFLQQSASNITTLHKLKILHGVLLQTAQFLLFDFPEATLLSIYDRDLSEGSNTLPRTS